MAISKSTVASANDVQWQSNGAWGERRYQQWNGPLDNLLNPDSTAKGFTDHEHLDAVGLIHMNGRVYDPELGRFMSADPFVQAPYNSQSYNRYSYVFNNPLSFTDPTGYITKDYCPGNTTATCTSDNKDKEEPAPEEVIVTGDREQHLRRMEAVDQSNLAGWINWTNHQNFMADVTAGMLVGRAMLSGGSTVWSGVQISVEGYKAAAGVVVTGGGATVAGEGIVANLTKGARLANPLTVLALALTPTKMGDGTLKGAKTDAENNGRIMFHYSTVATLKGPLAPGSYLTTFSGYTSKLAIRFLSLKYDESSTQLYVHSFRVFPGQYTDAPNSIPGTNVVDELHGNHGGGLEFISTVPLTPIGPSTIAP